MSGRKITVEFLGNDRDLQKTLHGVEGSTSSLGGKLAKFGKVAALGLAAAGAGALAVGKVLVDAGERASTSNARIQNIADSMGIFGDQAGEVTDRLVKLAEKQALATGVDQNAIKATQAKLLTFKELAESADTAGGAFDRATAAAVDMAASGFGSAESNAVQLGKALNDPIKGITALNKSGITFTEVEKAKIEAMVESGKTGEAQAKILRAIEKQVGGTAEATANGSDQMKVAFSLLQERLGQKLLPVFNRLSAWVIDTALPAFEKFTAWLGEKIPPIFAKVKEVISGFLGGTSGDVSGTFAKIKAIFKDAVAIITALWNAFGKNITQYVKSSMKNIKTIFSGVFKVIQGIFKTFSSLLKGDWKGVWEGIKLILKGAWQVIVGIVKQAFNLVRFAFKNAGVALKAVFSAIWDGIKALAVKGMQGIIDAVKAIPGKIGELAGKFGDVGKALITAFINGMKGAGGLISDIAGNVWNAVKGLLNSAIGKINSALEFRINLPLGKSITINPPDIPYLAKGGIVNRPTLAVVGEDGPEAVIPLTKRNMPSGVGFTSGGGGGITVHIHGALDPVAVGRQVEQVLIRYTRATGRPLQVQTR